MKIFYRICNQDAEITDPLGRKFCLKEGKRYLTADGEDGNIIVFTTTWFISNPELFTSSKQEVEEKDVH